MNVSEKLRTVLLIGLTVCCGIFGLACNASVNANSLGQASNTQNENQTWPAAEPADKVPPSLVDAGEFGENIYVAAKVGNWKVAQTKLAGPKTSALKISALKVGSPTFTETLANLDTAVTANDKKQR